jgi:hypothetical protein
MSLFSNNFTSSNWHPTDVLHKKGYARIYTTDDSNIEKIKIIIKTLNPYEEGYMARDLITTVDEYPRMVYNGKFDEMNMYALSAICMKLGIPMFYITTNSDSMSVDALKVFKDNIKKYKAGEANDISENEPHDMVKLERLIPELFETTTE